MGSRLSRMSFLACAASTLAACSSSAGGSIPVPNLASQKAKRRSKLNAQDLQSARQSIVISSNAKGTAYAIHSTSGALLGSLAYGPAFMRITDQRGVKTVLSTTRKRTKGWNFLQDGSRAALVRSRKGTVGAIFAPAENPNDQILAYFDKNARSHFEDIGH